MNERTTQKTDTHKRESSDYNNDFMILTSKEKRVVLKTAKNLLKLQQENMNLVKNRVGTRVSFYTV